MDASVTRAFHKNRRFRVVEHSDTHRAVVQVLHLVGEENVVHEASVLKLIDYNWRGIVAIASLKWLESCDENFTINLEHDVDVVDLKLPEASENVVELKTLAIHQHDEIKAAELEAARRQLCINLHKVVDVANEENREAPKLALVRAHSPGRLVMNGDGGRCETPRHQLIPKVLRVVFGAVNKHQVRGDENFADKLTDGGSQRRMFG